MAASSLSDLPASGGRSLPVVPWERVESFVGQLAHDIRNGLNALELQLTFIGEISTDPEAVEEIKRVRATLGNVTRHLQTLRNATGGVRPYPLEYPAREFFDDLRERLAKLHPESDRRIVWETGLSADSMLAVDPELTLNALLELFANALAFGGEGASPIRVIVTMNGEMVAVTLHEPQPAPPAISLQEWGAPLLTTRRGAYGLGLFRVRRVIEAQGGELEVEYSKEDLLLITRATLRLAAPK